MAAARESTLSRMPFAAKLGIILGLPIVTGVIYYVMFYADVAKRIQDQQESLIQRETELAEVKRAEFAYQRDKAELIEREQRQRELNKILPADAQYPAFLSALQNVANVTGVSILSWTPQPEREERFYARVPMQLEFSGRFHQVAKYFYQVGQLDRIINIENISLTEPEEKGDEILIKVSALATAFRSKSAAAVDPRGGAPK